MSSVAISSKGDNYIDDIIITGSDATLVNNLISSCLSILPRRPWPFALLFRIQAITQTDDIHLSQPQYLRDLLIGSKSVVMLGEEQDPIINFKKIEKKS
jgi:hypothetical protein